MSTPSHLHLQQPPLRLALVCGGPSRERGISLNSARSLLDHLGTLNIVITPYYVDCEKQFYSISRERLYSNTPADFDFKLHQTTARLDETQWIAKLREHDIVFPVIHGAFGEDGQLQQLLEQHQIPFVGPSSQTARLMFHKHEAASLLARHHFTTLPNLLITKDDNPKTAKQKIVDFWQQIDTNRVVIKPAAGGSSIGVFTATSIEETYAQYQRLSAMDIHDATLIEPFCQGQEFTLIVLENPDGQPVALVPHQIKIDHRHGQIFDYRRKYLPTSNTMWACPPHFSDDVVENIRQQAQTLFMLFQMRDFARLDGWLLDDGQILFTDFNPISGMEQNSFIFQQATRIGMTHASLLHYIIGQACRRHEIPLPPIPPSTKDDQRQAVHVLIGGKTAERQVSLMSGTNIWLKLRHSSRYQPSLYFIDHQEIIWRLPYSYALSHTVEEIYENCLTADVIQRRMQSYTQRIHQQLKADHDYWLQEDATPKSMNWSQFVHHSQQQGAFVFLGLHGGDGENGVYQQKLDDAGLPYNGSHAEASRLCMNKYLTGLAVSKAGYSQLISAPKVCIKAEDIPQNLAQSTSFWQNLCQRWSTDSLIIKPLNDGCSAGIIRLAEAEELMRYMDYVRQGKTFLEAGLFKHQAQAIEMASAGNPDFLLEPFIITDELIIDHHQLKHQSKQGWIELTVGVLAQKGHYHALNPSITVSEDSVLSLEEKFQGGTGINITPPPTTLITKAQCAHLKRMIEKAAEALGIDNYARIDIFFNRQNNDVMIIEANSLPALTPSTVIYHQGLAEPKPLAPRTFLENLIDLRMERVRLDDTPESGNDRI